MSFRSVALIFKVREPKKDLFLLIFFGSEFIAFLLSSTRSIADLNLYRKSRRFVES